MAALDRDFYDGLVAADGKTRPHADVPPMKGVYRDVAGSELSASVRMTRSDVSPSRA